MKKILILALAFVALLTVSLSLTTELVDNRDYPEDGYEIYVLDTHIGYFYAESNEVKLSLTGK